MARRSVRSKTAVKLGNKWTERSFIHMTSVLRETEIEAHLLESKAINLLLNLSELQSRQTTVNPREPSGFFYDLLWLPLSNLIKKKKGNWIVPELSQQSWTYCIMQHINMNKPLRFWTQKFNKLLRLSESVLHNVLCTLTCALQINSWFLLI